MRNLMLVDDSDVDRMITESVLDGHGFVCVPAKDGAQALEKLSEWQIDAVITDLVMPNLDGLGLVKAMRRDFPSIPVILTTAEGSEETAAEALTAGASSYIPKKKLGELLFPSVQRVLDILEDSADPICLNKSLKNARFDLEIENDPSQLRALVEFVEKTLRVVAPVDRNERLRISMAIDQGLHNAMYRGNLEIPSEYKVPFIGRMGDTRTAQLVDERLNSLPYAKRKLQVVLEFKKERFGIRIRDEGPGFDCRNAGTWDHPEFRGIILMNAFMDRVEYNDKGNDVQMYNHYGLEQPAAPQTQQAAAVSQPAAKPKVAQLNCLNTGTILKLAERKLVVGTRPNCHIRLKEGANVAPLHCMFVPESRTWTVMQMSPDFETLVNMQRVQGRAILKDGDTISVGSYAFELKFVEQEAAV